MKVLKGAAIVFSILFLMLPGLVFTLQGANILRGSSFMVNNPQWLIIGLAMLAAGGLIFYFASRKRRDDKAGPAA